MSKKSKKQVRKQVPSSAESGLIPRVGQMLLPMIAGIAATKADLTNWVYEQGLEALHDFAVLDGHDQHLGTVSIKKLGSVGREQRRPTSVRGNDALASTLGIRLNVDLVSPRLVGLVGQPPAVRGDILIPFPERSKRAHPTRLRPLTSRLYPSFCWFPTLQPTSCCHPASTRRLEDAVPQDRWVDGPADVSGSSMSNSV